MSIYLISNNTDIDKSLFQNIKNDDIIVFMNHSYWKKNFNKSKSIKLKFLRSQMNTFTKYQSTFNNQYNTVYFINDKNYSLKLYNDFKDNKKLIDNNIVTKIIQESNYTKNKIPSTGFITYHFIKNLINKNKNNKTSIFFNKSISNIFLIGFYYNKEYYQSKEHDFKYEKKYYKINNIKIL